MSAKNVMNSDFIAKNLTPLPDADPPYLPVTTTASDPLFSFTAKKSGYVRVDCNLTVSPDADGADVICKVSMRAGRTSAATGEAILYAQPAVVALAGYGVGHFVISVVAGTLYDVIASTGAVSDILSGVVSMQYL